VKEISGLPSNTTIVNHQSWIFRVVQVRKSLQDPLKVGNDLTGIDDNVSKRGLEEKCFQSLTEGRKRRSRGHVVWQTVPNGWSGDWEGPAANSRQFHGRHQQKVGSSRTEATATREMGDTNQLTQV